MHIVSFVSALVRVRNFSRSINGFRWILIHKNSRNLQEKWCISSAKFVLTNDCQSKSGILVLRKTLIRRCALRSFDKSKTTTLTIVFCANIPVNAINVFKSCWKTKVQTLFYSFSFLMKNFTKTIYYKNTQSADSDLKKKKHIWRQRLSYFVFLTSKHD